MPGRRAAVQDSHATERSSTTPFRFLAARSTPPAVPSQATPRTTTARSGMQTTRAGLAMKAKACSIQCPPRARSRPSVWAAALIVSGSTPVFFPSFLRHSFSLTDSFLSPILSLCRSGNRGKSRHVLRRRYGGWHNPPTFSALQPRKTNCRGSVRRRKPAIEWTCSGRLGVLRQL